MHLMIPAGTTAPRVVALCVDWKTKREPRLPQASVTVRPHRVIIANSAGPACVWILNCAPSV